LKIKIRADSEEHMMLQTLIVLLLIVLDQYCKYLAKIYLKVLPFGTYPLIKDIFHLTYVENRGAAFSILENQRWFLLTVTLLAIIFIVYFLFKRRQERLIFRISLSMILAGAVGNFIDRVRNGYVVDFFDFRLINFAVFNVADCAVVVGTILLAVYILFFYDNDHKKISE
jgi:signal peptidase II